MKRARILPRANKDIESTAEHYATEHGFDLAVRFLSACADTFDWLLENPSVGSPRVSRSSRLQGIRMWPVRGFEKLLVFYQPLEDGIRIVRVLHGARDIPTILELEG